MASVPNEAWVLVADGRKALLLRNEGDAELLNLRRVSVEEQDNPPTRDQGTDAPGRSASGPNGRRSAMEPTDWHDIEEHRFAAAVAASLNAAAEAQRFNDLIVVAPPRTLADLRREWSKGAAERVRVEIAKDLTSHPIPDIEKIVAAA